MCARSQVFWVLPPSSFGRQQALNLHHASAPPSESVRPNIPYLRPPRAAAVSTNPFSFSGTQSPPGLAGVLPSASPAAATKLSLQLPLPIEPFCFPVLGSDGAPILGRTWGHAFFTPRHSPSAFCPCLSLCPLLLSSLQTTWAKTAESLDLRRGGLEEDNFLSGSPSLSGARGWKAPLSVCPPRPGCGWALL